MLAPVGQRRLNGYGAVLDQGRQVRGVRYSIGMAATGARPMPARTMLSAPNVAHASGTMSASRTT